MKWTIKQADKKEIKKYAMRLDIGSVLASLLIGLGIDIDTAEKLLYDPSDLIDITSKIYGQEDVASALLNQGGRTVRIFADYDVDGLTSGFILNDCLNLLGYDSEVHFPARSDGYGLNMGWARTITKKYDPKNLTIVTIDNGITAYEPIALLRELGAEVYIIDHHEPIDTHHLPDANAICDAWVDEKYGTHLCAAAVGWKIIAEMAQMSHTPPEMIYDIMMAYLPYVALATIADVMPPCDENRAIVQMGLSEINAGNSAIIQALMDADGIETLRTKDVAWTICPALNACSRMENIALAAQLFSLEDENDEAIKKTVRDIGAINRRRKELTESAFTEILEENDFSGVPIVFADATKYPIGIHGILAGKLVEVTGKPAIVYRKDGLIGHGSARAPLGVDIKSIVNEEAKRGNAIIAMGHAEACGVQILPEKIDAFQKDILSQTNEKIDLAPPEDEVIIDTVITPDDISYDTRQEISTFGYTAQELPTLGLIDVPVEVLPWETASGKRHAIFRIKDSRGASKYAVAWNALNRYEELGSPARMNLAGSLDSGAFCSYFKGAAINKKSSVFTVDQMDKAGGV